MPGPWEKFQSASQTSAPPPSVAAPATPPPGPWEKFADQEKPEPFVFQPPTDFRTKAELALPAEQQEELRAAREQQAALYGKTAEELGPSVSRRDQSIMEAYREQAPKGSVFARELEEFGAAPELGEMSVRSIKSALAGNLITNEAELGSALQSQIPGAELSQDPEGNALIKMPSGGTYALNKPGLSGQDFIQFATRALAFIPSVRTGASLASAIGRPAATEAALQTTEAAVGGDVDVGDVALAGGFGGAFKLGGKVVQGFKNRSEGKAKLMELIKNAPEESATAKYMLAGEGKIASDPVAKSAIKQGVDEGTVALIKGSSREDKALMRRALKTLKAGRTNKKFAIANRPGDSAGKSVLRRYKTVEDMNKQAGKSVKKAAEGLKGKAVNIGDKYDQFIDTLADDGVTFLRDKNGQLKGAYDDSVYTNAKSVQKLLNNFIKRSEQGSIDGLKAHRLKKVIDDSIEFGKKGKTGITGSAERALKELRAGVNETLRESSPAYAKANKKFSDTIGALDAFKKVAGPKFDATAPDQEKMLANVARTLMSNNQNRTPALNSINELQKVSAKYGRKFNDDILTQAAFMDELESLFGSSASTSFGGQIARSTKHALEAAAGTRGVKDLAIEGVSKGLEKARGLNEENLIKSLEGLLQRTP
jgi:hypothetical protein